MFIHSIGSVRIANFLRTLQMSTNKQQSYVKIQ